MSSTSSSPPLLRSSSSSPQLRFLCKQFSPSPSSVRFRPPQVTAAAAASCASSEKTRSACLSLSAPKPATSGASLYEILGIHMGASGNEIKAAFRKLARVCHPDVAAAYSAADDFMKIHSAYSTLSNPEKRADYDRVLFQWYRSVGARSGITSSSATTTSRFCSQTHRNWETDQCW